jgi:outer membrane protein
MKIRFVRILLAALGLSAVIASAAPAADLGDVGYLDQAAVGSLPAFQGANQQLAQYKTALDAQFATAMKSAHSDADRQRTALEFQQKFADRQNELMGPLFQRAQNAIAAVSANKNLTVVVDKRIVVYGGQDITKDVIDLVTSSQAVSPPSATPAPSEVGFVDQNSLDGLPKVKQANDDFAKFAQAQRAVYQQRFAQAKSDSDKQQIAKDYNKTLSDKQDSLLKPLVDQTKSVTADVARQKNILLVIDRADVLYGGTDITKDVQDALSK